MSGGRRAAPTSFTPFEARVRALLADEPELPAVVLAERVGWIGSITRFRQNVERLRPEHRPVDPADRLVWEAGDAAQCDLWFPPKKILLEDGTSRLLSVLVITAAHSRFMLARTIPTQTTEDLLLGNWELLGQLGRVPRRLIWDNEGGIGRGRRLAEGSRRATQRGLQQRSAWEATPVDRHEDHQGGQDLDDGDRRYRHRHRAPR